MFIGEFPVSLCLPSHIGYQVRLERKHPSKLQADTKLFGQRHMEGRWLLALPILRSVCLAKWLQPMILSSPVSPTMYLSDLDRFPQNFDLMMA